MSFLESRQQPAPQGIGKPVRRREDARFLTGAGKYADEVSLPGQAILGVTAVVESGKAVKATFWARLIRKARHGAQASGTGGSTPLPPEPPRRMGVFGGTRRLSRRRTNEQASHDEGLVKGSHHGDFETCPVASVSKVQAHLCDAALFPSTVNLTCGRRSLAAAPRSRFRRAGLRKTRTILESGISGHGLLRFVYLDPPGLVRSWGNDGVRGWCYCC